jgi:nucleoside triphosphate pyrophosphatase
MSDFRLVLASGSPARKELLHRAGFAFDVIPSQIEEPTGSGFQDPQSFVEHVAWLKAHSVAARMPGDARVVILAADTVGWLDGRVIGKPADESDARRILRTLAGREHELWTGVCLWYPSKNIQLGWQEMSRVVMRAMNETELDNYLATRQWEGCSGAYAIQENHDPYVQIMEGSMTNVIGLPMETLAKILQWFPAP